MTIKLKEISGEPGVVLIEDERDADGHWIRASKAEAISLRDQLLAVFPLESERTVPMRGLTTGEATTLLADIGGLAEGFEWSRNGETTDRADRVLALICKAITGE